MKLLIPSIKSSSTTGPTKWQEILTGGLSKMQNTELTVCDGLECISKVKDCDVVHVCVASPLTLVLLFLGKVFSKKVIFTIHGDYYREYKNKTGYKKIFWLWFYRTLSRYCTLITFPSRYLFNQISTKERWVKGKAHVILNGINKQEVRPDQTNKYKEAGVFLIATVTNFNLSDKAMGVEKLCEEFLQFRKIHSNSKLIIAGDGKYLEFYKSKYESPEIKFLGYLADIPSFIDACDLFAYYSYLDNLPYAVLEALSLSKPVQALPTGGLPEILPKEYITDGKINKIDAIQHLPANISSEHMCEQFSSIYNYLCP